MPLQHTQARALLALVLWCAAACGDDATSGREVRLQTRLVADAEIEQPFMTATGWSVKLTKAAVSVGGFYYFEGEPAFVLHGRPSLFEHLAGLFRPSIAHAHPGHYLAGMAMGQMLEPYAVNLLDGTAELPAGMGISGLYRSARFVLAEPSAGPALTELAGQVALAAGVATHADQTVYFSLSAKFSDVTRSVSNGQVEGCEFEATEVTDDGVVEVSIKPHVWFNLVDFTGVAPGSADAPTKIAAGETPQIAFALGLVQLSAYHFVYSAAEAR